MPYHKVILSKVSLKSDLRGVVHTVCTVLNVKPREAVDMVKNLPLTLTERCSSVQAVTFQQIFQELRAEVVIEPPVRHEVDVQNFVPVKLPSKMKRVFSGRPALLAVVGLLVVSLLGIVFGGKFILEHVHPTEFVGSASESLKHLMKSNDGMVEDAQQDVASHLSKNPRSATLLIQKAVVYLGIARKRMNAQNWQGFGGHGEVPVDGQDLLPAPEADTALKALFAARALEPNNPEVYRWLAELYRQKGLGPESVRYASKALQLQDTSGVYGNLLGLAYLETDNVGQAELAFRATLQKSPHDLQTYRNLGLLLLYHQNDTIQGVEWIYQYLQREPGLDMDRYSLRERMVAAAVAYFNPPWDSLFPARIAFDDYEPKRKMLEKQIHQDNSPQDREAMASLYLARGMDEAALPIFVELSKENNPSAFDWKMLICLQAKTAQWAAMQTSLQRALDAGMRDPFFTKNMGVMQKYYLLDREAARAAWIRYLDQGADLYKARVQVELSHL